MKRLLVLLLLTFPWTSMPADWVVYHGEKGPGKGKQMVFIAGDEEYRSEESLPMLAQILAVRHGFQCTVLFSQDPNTGRIDPNNATNIPGLHFLKDADMLVLQTRFRELPDEQMKYFVEYLHAGKPILAIRTATHAFDYQRNKQSPFAKYSWNNKEWPGGFGQQILGETWVSHHGNHGHESSRGMINPQFKNHPILKGVADIWGPTDVYGVVHLPKDAQVLVFGEVLQGMKPSDPPVESAKNHPMMPLIWVRQYPELSGKTSRIVCSTIGAAVDLQNEGLRRLFVNACYWGLGLEEQIPDRANVEYVSEFHPSFFGFGKFKHGLKPSDYELKH